MAKETNRSVREGLDLFLAMAAPLSPTEFANRTSWRFHMLNEAPHRSFIWLALFVAAFLLLPSGAAAQATPAPDPGALISMTMKGTVGVLLDEIPAGKWREQAALEALEEEGDAEFW